MHVQTRLLHGEGKVRARNSQVLQRPSQTPVRLGIVDHWSIGREFALSVDWCCSRLAVCHPSALENVLGVALLGQTEAFGCTLDVDAEEEAQITKILDSELQFQALDDVLEERRTGTCEHDVVDI